MINQILTNSSNNGDYKISAIALGSNMGDSQKTLESALQRLDETPNIKVKNYSSWYKTTPIGPSQAEFLNGCAVLEVGLAPHDLLNILLKIEDEFGRVRQERWGPRTLDLDLILYEDLILNTPNLTIPHPEMLQRAFVLVPLAEIAPNMIEPQSGLSIRELSAKVEQSGVTLLAS